MIDMAAEPLLSISDAAKLVPAMRSGKPTHPATLVRWITKGVRGIKLEATRIGGRWCTSREALSRFAERSTAAAVGRTPDPTPPPTAVRRDAERAGRELVALGF